MLLHLDLDLDLDLHHTVTPGAIPGCDLAAPLSHDSLYHGSSAFKASVWMKTWAHTVLPMDNLVSYLSGADSPT
jgi:hypothetical protein